MKWQRSSAQLRHRVQRQGCARAGKTRVDLLHRHALKRLYMTARDGLRTASVARDERVDHRVVIVFDLGFCALHTETERDEARHFIEQTRQRSMQTLICRSRWLSPDGIRDWRRGIHRFAPI